MSSDNAPGEPEEPTEGRPSGVQDARRNLINALAENVSDYQTIERVTRTAMPDRMSKIVPLTGPTLPDAWNKVFVEAERSERMPDLLHAVEIDLDYPGVRRALDGYRAQTNIPAGPVISSKFRSYVGSFYDYLLNIDNPAPHRLDELRRVLLDLYRELEDIEGESRARSAASSGTARQDEVLQELDELLEALYIYRGLISARSRAASASIARLDLAAVASDLQQLADGRRSVLRFLRAVYRAL